MDTSVGCEDLVWMFIDTPARYADLERMFMDMTAGCENLVWMFIDTTARYADLERMFMNMTAGCEDLVWMFMDILLDVKTWCGCSWTWLLDMQI